MAAPEHRCCHPLALPCAVPSMLHCEASEKSCATKGSFSIYASLGVVNKSDSLESITPAPGHLKRPTSVGIVLVCIYLHISIYIIKNKSLKIGKKTCVWWHIPLIAVLRRQRPADLCEFKAILVYIVAGQPELHNEILFQQTKTTKRSGQCSLQKYEKEKV